ncbi:adhesion G-protein coupled receptor G2-like [Centropristis striata]|uniref:adhesion G-protein coupled receptor G2-like n=1 Tax=Centropristis striata TaxID=184440 RepID=UPI0027E032B4|nr:adhesion G-protein coupled receptor G2-like [Centropristis striata]
MSWTSWVLFVGLLWFYFASFPISAGEPSGHRKCCNPTKCNCFKDWLKPETSHVVVLDNFTGVISASNYNKTGNDACPPGTADLGLIFFLQNNPTKQNRSEIWPEIDGDELLISKIHTKRKIHLYVLKGNCDTTDFCQISKKECVFNHTSEGPCQIRCVDTGTICEESHYAKELCMKKGEKFKERYFINISKTSNNCGNCDNPVKEPETDIRLNTTIEIIKGEEIDAAQAAEVMNQMPKYVKSFNGSSAAITLGEGITGVIVKEAEPLDFADVSFAYSMPSDDMKIIEDKRALAQFSRSVTVSKEAFQKALDMNISVPFAAILRFFNLTSDENNSTILGNEILAVEMGTTIANLTDKMTISFQNVSYEGYPSCHSWNGEGKRPNWTEGGCVTKTNGSDITCECSHLTFFAILLTPLNETISVSDLNTLTMISQIGCGLSLFFLCVVLFMHFLMRRTKANIATHILIHLVIAMSLLNLSFLVNNIVAEMKNSVGCIIMAAAMHYSMLATFSWFAAQAFHLCLQLYVGGSITIRHYLLKVSIIGWVLPAVVVSALLGLDMYGEQAINTSDSGDSRAMCWITDNNVHMYVNIGYYAVVFLVTFTTFIIILTWLFCLKRTKSANAESGKNGKNIVTIMGLCCMLGVSWGFAFFAYGPLRIPAYYIFTILNSFQGFFLFIYYYNTSHSGEIVSASHSSNATSISTLHSNMNPYSEPPDKVKKP